MTDEQDPSGHSPPAANQWIESGHTPIRVLFVTTRNSDQDPLRELGVHPQFGVETVDVKSVLEYLGERKIEYLRVCVYRPFSSRSIPLP